MVDRSEALDRLQLDDERPVHDEVCNVLPDQGVAVSQRDADPPRVRETNRCELQTERLLVDGLAQPWAEHTMHIERGADDGVRDPVEPGLGGPACALPSAAAAKKLLEKNLLALLRPVATWREVSVSPSQVRARGVRRLFSLPARGIGLTLRDMKALVTGATGLVGKRLVPAIDGEARALTRDQARGEKALPGARVFEWDALGPLPADALEGVDTVFHLLGEPVGEGRWTDEKKKRIRESREGSTRALVGSIGGMEEGKRPKVLVSASAVGIYGDRGDEVLTERSALGDGFLADVCKDWETEAKKAEALGVRVVLVRIGVVLARDGGALAKMLPLFKAGIAGPLASGKQWMPWLHIDDAIGLLIHAAKEESLSGPMNACAPEPVTNKELTKAMGAFVHRPAFMPVPKFAIKALYGEMGSVVLASQRVVPERALASGYVFRFTSLRGALEAA